MIRTVCIKEGVVTMTRNKFTFMIRTLGTSVRSEKNEEVPSERTVQQSSVQLMNQRMYHVAKPAT